MGLKKGKSKNKKLNGTAVKFLKKLKSQSVCEGKRIISFWELA